MPLCLTLVCGECRKETDHLAVLVAVAVSGVSKPSLYRWMDRFIHYRKLPNGHRMICLESLRKVAPIDSGLLAALIEDSRPSSSGKTVSKLLKVLT